MRTNQEVAQEFRDGPREYSGSDGGVRPLSLDLYLTTLLYGGGVEAGHPDEITPFRPSSIRGHLRFWWRATRGAAFDNWEDLRDREGQIWGDTDNRSPVRIRVDCIDPPKKCRLDKILRDDPVRYALFPPYNEKAPDLSAERLRQGGRFKLTVSLESKNTRFGEDVESALWGWVNFGGMGARTRRGAGALYCPHYAGWDPKRIAGTGDTKPWPTLKGGALICGAKEMLWEDCWKQLLRVYREFRQDREQPRGRTRWPEPQEIRAIRGSGDSVSNQGFPRGGLGMPIIFHKVEPRDQTLSPAHSDRMASPVILRPFAISPTHALPTLLVLNTRQPGKLCLHEGMESGKPRRPKEVTDGHRDAIAELISRIAQRFSTSPVRI